MSDLISRKEAIKAVKFYETFYDPYPRVIEALEDLPSAQPETNCSEIPNNSDLISRQAAIDLVKSFYKIDKSVLKIMVFKLKQLPSVQPETNWLIDADALRESIITRQTEMSYEDAWALTCVDNAPTIEPQPEIIRCKDCEHWAIGKTTKNYPNPYVCELHSFMHGFERSALPEDYCSWGELRGDPDD